MTVELFTLCDGAYNYNGKLTIVGSLTSVTVEKIPARIQMSVAIRMRVEAEENGSRQFKLRFVNPDKTIIPARIVADLELSPSEEISYINFAGTIQGLPIGQEGVYMTEVLIDDNCIGTYPFSIHNK